MRLFYDVHKWHCVKVSSPPWQRFWVRPHCGATGYVEHLCQHNWLVFRGGRQGPWHWSFHTHAGWLHLLGGSSSTICPPGGAPLAGESVLHVSGGINLALQLKKGVKMYNLFHIPSLYKKILNVIYFPLLLLQTPLKRPRNMKTSTLLLDVQPLSWNRTRKQMHVRRKGNQGRVAIPLFLYIDLLNGYKGIVVPRCHQYMSSSLLCPYMEIFDVINIKSISGHARGVLCQYHVVFHVVFQSLETWPILRSQIGKMWPHFVQLKCLRCQSWSHAKAWALALLSSWRMYACAHHFSPIKGSLVNKTDALKHHNCPLYLKCKTKNTSNIIYFINNESITQ